MTALRFPVGPDGKVFVIDREFMTNTIKGMHHRETALNKRFFPIVAPDFSMDSLGVEYTLATTAQINPSLFSVRDPKTLAECVVKDAAQRIERRVISDVMDHLNADYDYPKGMFTHRMYGIKVIPSVHVEDDILLCSFGTMEKLMQITYSEKRCGPMNDTELIKPFKA